LTLFDEPELPPHLRAGDGPDPEAEAVISALARVFGRQPWRIGGEREAEWCANRWAAAKATIDAIDAHADEYAQRIEEWRKARTAEAERTVAWASAHLTRWLEREHEADPKVLSRKLPSATVASKAGGERWEIHPDLFIPWALVNGRTDLLKITPALNEAKKALERKDDQAIDPDTSELIPGVIVEDSPRSFRVDPAR